jgi:hypothetical protein
MKRPRLARPSPALVIAIIALIVALGGTGYAAVSLPKNSVGSKQLKKNAVIGSKIKANAVTGSKVKNGSLTGADINLGTLGTVPNATNAANATHAGSADNATNAGNSAKTGGNTVRAFSLYGTSPVTDHQILDLDGLQLNASCTGGSVTLTAHTTTSDNEISAFTHDGSSGTEAQAFSDSFNAGDSFAVPMNTHSDEIGQLRFTGADGHFVDLTYNEEDSTATDDCLLHGFAIGN